MSELNKILQNAVDARLEVARLESSYKLSTRGFLDEALALAGCDEARLDEIERTLNESRNSDSARSFIRRISKLYSEGAFPRPYQHFAKALRAWGSESAAVQLNENSVKIGEALALAARFAVQRWPERFGTHDSYEAHERKIEQTRARLIQLCGQLEGLVTMADLELSHETLSEHERQNGHVIARLKTWPAIAVVPGWPQRLVEHVAAQRQAEVSSEPKPKPAPSRRTLKRREAQAEATA